MVSKHNRCRVLELAKQRVSRADAHVICAICLSSWSLLRTSDLTGNILWHGGKDLRVKVLVMADDPSSFFFSSYCNPRRSSASCHQQTDINHLLVVRILSCRVLFGNFGAFRMRRLVQLRLQSAQAWSAEISGIQSGSCH